MWKRIVQNQLRKFGYELHKRGDETVYTPRPPYPHSTYSPWFDDWFRAIYAGVKDRTEVTEDRCYVLHQVARQCAHLGGEFAEAGVYKGGTARLLAQVVAQHSKPHGLHLFDTFAGMPASAAADPSGHAPGDFGDNSEASVRAYLQEFPFVRAYPGIIPATLSAVEAMNFAFVHVDVDLYQTGLDCCNFFYPRLVPGGSIVFDDYGFPKYERAMRAAVDSFFSDKPESVVVLATGQCFISKLNPAAVVA
jgi:hypothetical protein